MAAVFRAPPERREAVGDAFDRSAVEALRADARGRSSSPPAPDLDAGRGADTDSQPASRGSWPDAIFAVLDER